MIRRTQIALFIVSGVTALWVAYGSVRAAVYREVQTARLEKALEPAAHARDEMVSERVDSANDGKDNGVGPDGVVGILEIPRLKVSEVVASGDDNKTLDTSIGHLTDTPLPWARGNSVLAAHRDTHFRPLRDIHHGDLIRLKTKKGVLEYVVTDTMIVEPKDVWVMDQSQARRLTLVTCYPFNFIGSAPQRFIVKAEAR